MVIIFIGKDYGKGKQRFLRWEIKEMSKIRSRVGFGYGEKFIFDGNIGYVDEEVGRKVWKGGVG